MYRLVTTSLGPIIPLSHFLAQGWPSLAPLRSVQFSLVAMGRRVTISSSTTFSSVQFSSRMMHHGHSYGHCCLHAWAIRCVHVFSVVLLRTHAWAIRCVRAWAIRCVHAWAIRCVRVCRANSSITAMPPPCSSLLEEIVIRRAIHGSLVW